MKKIVLFAALLCASCCYMAAQVTANSSPVQETQNVQADITEFPEEVLSKSISASLSKKGNALNTINKDGSIYVIGAATTARPSNMPGFVNSRNVAYAIAEMTAKMNLLRLAGEQISSGRGFQLVEDIVEGEDPDAKQKASLLEKAAKLVDKSIDKALEALGVSQSEIKAMNEDKKKAVYEQNFNQTVRSLVAGMVKGCAVVRIAEGESGNNDYQVAVCLKYSPKFQSFASAIQNGGGKVPTGGGKSSKNTIMTMPESDLLKRMGVWITYDENGKMVVYGFGQQEVRETGARASAATSRAYNQARLQAVNNIKNFVAEDIVANESMQNVEKLREYADGTEAYFSRQKWEQAVKAKETSLNIATEQVRQWKAIHPLSNTTVVGYVVAWTPDNAAKANQIKQKFNASQNPGSQSQQAGKQNNTSVSKTKKGKITISGDDDDL